MPTVADILETIKLSEPKEYIKMLPKKPTPYEIEHNRIKANELLSKLKFEKNDPKSWAISILDRHAQGKYRLEIGVKFAKEALRLK